MLIEEEFLNRISGLNLPCPIVAIKGEQLTISQKVSKGIVELSDVDYVTWLGDDDLLDPAALVSACETLDANQALSFVYGRCQYIDSANSVLIENKAGGWAMRILSWGPDLIPQPGTVWRHQHYEEIGGIDESFTMAFDFDLFLRLNRFGGGSYDSRILSQFRWHKKSSSVSGRWDSVLQASRVRVKNKSLTMVILTVPIEILVTVATWMAGKLMTLRVSART